MSHDLHNKERGFVYGITTGSSAAAAALAAFLSIENPENNEISYVKIKAPFGELKIDLNSSRRLTETSGEACVIKMPYNDPDVTENIEVCANVQLTDVPGIKIKGGKGVGVVTKPGLQVSVGEPAINPIPKRMIEDNLVNVLPEHRGVVVTINVPHGGEIAKKTMNSRLGINGGISILGTSGIARPLSSASYKESLRCQIDVAVAQGYKDLVFVPGNIGEKLAFQVLDVSGDEIVQMGNFAGYMLQEASEKGVQNITLFGHAGKLVKIAAGIYNTKNIVADGRQEVIAAYSALAGAKREVIGKIFESNTTEEMIDILSAEDLIFDVFDLIASSIKKRCEERFKINFKVFIVRMDGTVLNRV